MIMMQLSYHDFQHQFLLHRRQHQFTSDALRVIFNHIEEMAEDSEKPYQLDVIELCCEFSEYKTEDALVEYRCKDEEELSQNYFVLNVNDDSVIISE